MAKVVLKNLSKRFGKLEAVKNVNLEVNDGEFTCMLGPSGCGKTTTLRMIAGLETPDSGEIYIGGKVVNDLSPQERDVAMVFQFYAMYPGMTVYENLAFPLEARKMPRDEIRIRVKEAASLLRIEHLLDKIATKLTAGEKQRVALGRAIVRRPQVYLLDEPLTNLDARLRAEMRVELKALQRKLKQTTIYVTHDQLEGMTMADRIAVMSQGEIQQYDTPDNIYRYPRNLFVAGFVGSPTMNFLDCTFKEHGKGYIFDFGSFTLDASRYSDIIEKYSTSPELILGVRPEHVSVHSESITDGIKGRLEVFEPLGDSFIYDVSVNGSILRVLMLQRLDLRPGEDVWLKFDPERVYIFDKKTSKALI